MPWPEEVFVVLVVAVAWAAAICICALVAWDAWLHPATNWDLVAYTGVLKSWTSSSPSAVHAGAYQAVAAFAAHHGHAALWSAGHTSYQRAVATSPRDFMEQLPFYRPAAIYLTTAWALTYCAPSLPAAIADVSIIATALSVGVVGAFAWRRTPGIKGALFVAAFCLLPPIRSAAHFQTPDAMAMLIVVCAAILYISEHRIGAAVLLLLGVGVRSDVMVFAVILGALTLSDFLRQRDRASAIAIATMLGTIPANFAVGAIMGGYGYLTLIKFSFFDLAPNIATVESLHFSLVKFAHVVITATTDPRAALMISITLMGAILIAWRLKSNPHSTAAERTLYAAAVFFLIAHTLLFPQIELRFFAPSCGVLAVVLISSVGHGQAFRTAAVVAPVPE